MLYSSLKGKLLIVDRALARLNLKGDEKILDVGCGKGLFLIKSAKQLKSGKAIGIDIWRKQDLSRNQIEKTVENIQLEGVEKQADVQSGDMREMPFEAASFDGVVASLAIHNLKEEKDREKALQEIDRVLKPGGKVLIIDFQKMDEYAAFFKKNYQVEISPKQWQMFPPTRILIATKVQSNCH